MQIVDTHNRRLVAQQLLLVCFYIQLKYLRSYLIVSYHINHSLVFFLLVAPACLITHSMLLVPPNACHVRHLPVAILLHVVLRLHVRGPLVALLAVVVVVCRE